MNIKSYILLILLLSTIVNAQNKENEIFPYPDRIRYDSQCLQIEGKDIFIYSGAFHYFRTPKQLWADRFRKIKDAGFNTVETYVPWNYHEKKMPSSIDDYSKIDLTELEEWISMAEEFGFYVIIRPGPYICAEWDGGGFPQWLASKRPKKPKRSEMWLQTDDPEFLKWNKHWYSAVVKIVSPHQITKKSKGNPGVILFQVENEYERLKLPTDMKRKYLEDLVLFARNGGIEVPIFTCWTTQSRNIKEGPLHGVFDFVNQYPRWEVRKNMDRYTLRQKKDQPDAPLMTGELQGGWYSEVGGVLSKNQDGVSAAQLQNLALYTIQLGYSLINYYMLCGGTNFDDWASRGTTTTYDFAAAIGENGGTGEKYRRVSALGNFIKEHGERLIRSKQVVADISIADSLVQVQVSQSTDGSKYIFVRTEDLERSHEGTVLIKEKLGLQYSFSYHLEPFGSKVFYLPPSSTDSRAGEWYPKLPQTLSRPAYLPDTVKINTVQYREDLKPTKWKKLQVGETIDKHEVYDRHYLYYKARIPRGKKFEIGYVGDKLINRTKADAVIVSVDGIVLDTITSGKESVTYQMPNHKDEVIILFENRGLHHHTNLQVEEHWLNGIKWIRADGNEIPFYFASTEKEQGLNYSMLLSEKESNWGQISIGSDVIGKDTGLLHWYKFDFELPENKPEIWTPWLLNIEALGNGFIYLNGHCLGRYWAEGPQTSFYLPECWLKYGKNQKNIISFSVFPANNVFPKIKKVSISADYESAEFR